MSSTVPWRLLPLAPLAFLLACSDSRDLPSAPSLTAQRSASWRSDVPSPRGYPLMAHDPVNDRVYLVGGYNSAGFGAEIFDLWRFNPRSRTWNQLSDVLPPANGDAVALDVQSRKIIEYQPYTDPLQPQTWAYDIETGVWDQLNPETAPPARWGSMMVYDRESDRVLLYGGADWFTAEALGDLWAYDYETNTWTELHPPRRPPPHHFPIMVYVPTIDRVILFGGYQAGFETLHNDTWAYDFNRNRWTNLHPKNPPAPRVYHYMAFEPTSNRIVMFGGTLHPSDNLDEVPINETWIYSVAQNTWTQVFPEVAPSPRAWHVMSGTNGPVLLFGGGPSRFAYTNDTFLYSMRSNEWDQVPGENAAATATMVPTAPNLSTVANTGGGRVAREGPMPGRH